MKARNATLRITVSVLGAEAVAEVPAVVVEVGHGPWVRFGGLWIAAAQAGDSWVAAAGQTEGAALSGLASVVEGQAKRPRVTGALAQKQGELFELSEKVMG